LVGRARQARGCTTPGDDRIETRLYAVKRYLFRLGHAASSARFATSIEQLVVGLAPLMGWGAPPHPGSVRARFVRAHRKSVQRWLDDLEAAGLVAHEPEHDEHGRWWRTQIVLLAAPEPAPEERRVAERRARGWRMRARRRRRQIAKPVRSLEAIRRRTAAPGRRTRARIARSRAAAEHERQPRAAVERAIGSAREQREVRTHPFGAPPTSAQPSVSAKPLRHSETPRSARTLVAPPSLAARTDACADNSDAAVLRRVVERRDQERERIALRLEHAGRRVAAVVAWPAGQACPIGRLREAWIAYRHGLAWVAEGGRASAGPCSRAVEQRVAHAIRIYEQFAAARPPGWPATGPAALLALASQRRARAFAGDVARMLILAKQMRAAARERDALRRDRQASRAARRAAPSAGPLEFRRSAAARLESPEQRRQRVRDLVLLAGGDPALWPDADLALDDGGFRQAAAPALTAPDPCEELDGVGGRATRYRDELARGRYRLSPHWHFLLR
jgi:hypothetical protein